MAAAAAAGRRSRPAARIFASLLLAAVAKLVFLDSAGGGGLAFQPPGKGGAKPGITVEKMSKEEANKKYGVSSWGTWGCGVSRFDWVYSGTETAYILEGEVEITPTGDWSSVEPVTAQEGDLITCPDGMTCIWDVKKAILKHYSFS